MPTFWRGGGTQVYSKLMIEGWAGRYDWDTVSLTNPEFVFDRKQRSIRSRYKSPERETFSEDLKDQEGHWTGYYAFPMNLGFNTRMVKKDQVPKTYQDLLSPMWRKKDFR